MAFDLAVQVEHSPDMHPLGWMAYDADGKVIQAGIVGKGEFPRETDEIATRIVMGTQAFEELHEFATPLSQTVEEL